VTLTLLLHGESALNDSKLNIRKLRVRAVEVPMRLPLQTATGAVSIAPLVLLDLETTAGVTGRAYLFAVAPHNLKPIVALCEAMGEMIAGDAVAPFELERKLRQKYMLLGVHNIVLFAMSGIDMAAWDAYAQSLGEPLVKLLGGTPRPVKAYNSKGLGIMPLKSLAKEAEALVKEGFAAVKLRLGRADAQDDLAALCVVKKAIGPNIALMCDFNQALSVNDAILRGRMLDDEGGLTWIEEPTRADDFAGNAKIAAALATPVQIGENFMGPEQMAQALAAGASDYVMPDAQRIGGVTGWMRAAALAQGAGLEMSSHLFPEVSCHLLAVTPTCHWLEYVDWAEPILEEPVAIKDSCAMVPSRPGIGIKWDEKAVRKYAA
jgi:mandelate racemase